MNSIKLSPLKEYKGNSSYIDEIIKLNQKIKHLESLSKPLVDETTRLSISNSKLRKVVLALKDKNDFLEKEINIRLKKEEKLKNELNKIKETLYQSNISNNTNIVQKWKENRNSKKSKIQNMHIDTSSDFLNDDMSYDVSSKRILNRNNNNNNKSINFLSINKTQSNNTIHSEIDKRVITSLKKNNNLTRNSTSVVDHIPKIQLRTSIDLTNTNNINTFIVEETNHSNEIIELLDYEYGFIAELENQVCKLSDYYDIIGNLVSNHSYHHDYEVILKVKKESELEIKSFT